MAEKTLSDFLATATESFSSIIVVNQTTYNIQDHWMKLAARYFNIDTSTLSTDPNINETDDRISLLKAGLFGYFNEIASSEIKSAVYYKNTIYDEHFLNTASFPESIMNHAKLYNVEMSNATPSHMVVNLIVRQDDLITSPLRTEVTDDQKVNVRTLKTYQIILKRSYQFAIGKYKFKLPYDVQILLKQNSIKLNRQNGQPNDYTITARYLTDKNDFPFIDINSPEVKVYQDINGAEKYVYFQLDIYQLETIRKSFVVSSEDITDNLFYTVQYPNQLADFNVYYEYEGKTYTLKKYFNNTYNPVNRDEKYCYYTYVDNDQLQISFSSVTNSFRPRYNSKLTIEVDTTYGQEGNFNYSDQIVFNYSEEVGSNFSPMLTKVYPITNSASGGQDQLSTNQEKQKIIQAVLTRDNLIMDSDLKNYFQNINNMDSVNGSSIEFLKKRDDVLQRLYSAFLLMRDKDQKVIPTNTAKYSDIPISYFASTVDSGGKPVITTENNLIIPEHSVYEYIPKNDSYLFHPEGLTDEIKTKLKDPNNLIYVNPFLTKIELKPSLKATYYKLDIDKYENMSYIYLNDMNTETILVNKIHITKDSNMEDVLNTDTWSIDMNVNTSSNMPDLAKRIKIRGILVDGDTGVKYGYFEFDQEDPDNEPTKYTAHLSTDRTFQKGTIKTGSLLNLKNSLYDNNGNALDEVGISQNVVIKIGILLKDKEHNLSNNNDNQEVKDFMSQQFPPDEKDNDDQTKSEIGNYSLALSLKTIESIHLYRDLSNIMTSVVNRVYDESDPWNNGTNYLDSYMKGLLVDKAQTWVAINDEIQQVDKETGQAKFHDKDGHEYTIKVINTGVYRYMDGHLYRMINSNSVDMSKDFINDNTTDRLDGVICVVPDGVYIPRYDFTFTTVNGIHYKVVNTKQYHGIYESRSDGYHQLRHDGTVDPNPIKAETPIDPSTKTIVAFYDGIYQVTSANGIFTDKNGKQYQITSSGLYRLENKRRYKVISAYVIDRTKNYSDEEISTTRPNGLYAVLHDQLYKADEYGIVIGWQKYKYRVIPDGSYQGIYLLTNDGSAIYRTDMLGLTVTSINYKYDSNFPMLVNIWTGKKPEDPSSGLLNLPTISGNDNTIDMYNAIINAENKKGYNLEDLAGDGAFGNYIPDSKKDFRVELIPLVSLNYFAYQYNYIYELLDSYISILLDVVKRLENNTTIDLKFYNSYGPSYYWYLDYENQSEGKMDNQGNAINNYAYNYISRVNLLYDFSIHLFEPITDDVDLRIKKFISDFIEASNDSGVIAVSNLMRLLEENFDLIRYIEFNGLSGTVGQNNDPIINKYQKLLYRATDFLDMSTDEIRYYVPEYVNLKKQLHDNILTIDSGSIISSDDVNKPSSSSNEPTTIVQGKKYDYLINLTYSTSN